MVSKDKSVVVIELEFDYKPTDADVINYLHELIDNNCLDYYEKFEEVK